MSVTIKGDHGFDNKPSIEAKALRINLNPYIYGTFAEIGAGQEVARHFFKAGGSSGTIAKTISAYDKNFSDTIYGEEVDGRYVTETRLDKMMSHEMRLLKKRIPKEDQTNKMFFTLANTVATIDFVKKFKGHGWMGIRFQTNPDDDYSEIKLHLRFHQNEAKLQQESLGIMGVNLIYGAFYKHNEPLKLMKYLTDHIDDQSIIEAVNNTVEISQKVEVFDLFGNYRMPKFPLNEDIDSFSFLTQLSNKGLLKRLKKNDLSEVDENYKKRLSSELKIIKDMGFPDYFLVVWDYIKFARDNSIPVGPGRGSAAGSLVAYALQITNIDPVEHGLLFERFLNPARKSMPDIDTDFCIDRRNEVIDYVTNRYGEDKVAQIITFNKMTSKAVSYTHLRAHET